MTPPELVLLILLLLSLTLLGLAARAILRRSDEALRQVERIRDLESRMAELEKLVALREAGLDLADDAVLYLDGRRRIQYLNRAAEEMIGPRRGQVLTDAVRDRDLDSLLRRSIAEGQGQSAVLQLDWPPRLVRASVSLLGPSGILVVLSDQTELRRLQQVRRELVANVSHELRTPLASLQVLVDTLIGGAVDDSEARDQFLSELREQVGHMSELVRKSLHLAALESGRLESEFEQLEPRELVEPVVSRLRRRFERAGIRLEVEVPNDLPRVRADADQIGQVLTNLLENALRWTPKEGTVRICAEDRGEVVRFRVSDSGPGIPSEALPRLFERFYKADSARSGEGTGLGLAIAKHTVLLHGGEIWAESRASEGATFYFTLPTA